ncbi:hypothetical protein K3495_g5340 [Podosphaera aphanis]|nr:hypothetical protein K3495_g5340 [Podosphaera aphanis]
MIGKPNKTDMASPRSYRPIALLSVFGKGLERIVAKRMSWIAIQYKILARQQFGALPKRSSVDLITCLTHDVETALARGLTATMATLDIKGAFDAVLPGRLVRRLREQGRPVQLCNLIASFATERKVCIRLNGIIGEPIALNCGLPQGSTVSPILCMLYIAPLFRLPALKKAFGYADDVAVLETSPSLEGNSSKLGLAINQALSWGSTEGITFEAQNKSPQVANALRCLGNTVRGASPRLSRQAAFACVLPIAHFGAETWWPGKCRTSGRVICNRVGSHLGKLGKVYTATARAILPVYRTTPIAALLRETGLNSAEVALDDISRGAAIRTRRLDPHHPLFTRGQKSLNGLALTRFARTCRNIPASENNNPLLNPPWETVESRQNSLARICGPTGTKEFHANVFRTFLSTLLKSDIQVYLDGSKLPDGNAGGGYVIYQFGIQVCAKSFPLGKHKESYDAEIRAAQQGIYAAVALPSARLSNNLWIFIDNEEVARKILTNTPTTSSQQAFLEALEAPKIWKTRARLPHTSEGQINVRWVPSHAGIEGNELADLEVKKGAAIPFLNPAEYSSSALGKWIGEQIKLARDNWWQTSRPPTYLQLEIRNAPSFPKELLLSCKDLGRVVAARTGHGDFAAYHIRFKHEDAALNCLCGSLKTPTHFFFCRILRRRDGRPAGPINTLIPHLLGTPEGAIILSKWLDQSRFFEEICLG